MDEWTPSITSSRTAACTEGNNTLNQKLVLFHKFSNAHFCFVCFNLKEHGNGGTRQCCMPKLWLSLLHATFVWTVLWVSCSESGPWKHLLTSAPFCDKLAKQMLLHSPQHCKHPCYEKFRTKPQQPKKKRKHSNGSSEQNSSARSVWCKSCKKQFQNDHNETMLGSCPLALSCLFRKANGCFMQDLCGWKMLTFNVCSPWGTSAWLSTKKE